MGEALRAQSVEGLLQNICYKPDENYVPSDFALEFITFIKMVNGEVGEEHESPVLHYKMLDQIPGRGDDIVNMLFRGSAKTTVLGEYLFLFIATYGRLPGFGDVPLALYVSDSIENGVKNMRKNLEYRWENSEFLQTYVPKTRFTDVRWEFENKDGHVLVVKGYGAKTGVRGTKEMGIRPVLALMDDMISDEDARSATVIASVEDVVYKAIDYALHPTRSKTIWSGTPFNSRDPLYKAVESGAYKTNLFPVCEKFPCTREEFRSAWPDRFTYDVVKRLYDKALRNGKVEAFYQEMMLQIMSEEDRVILDSDINWYSRKTLMENRGAFNFYITTDFATSKRNTADYSVISVWAYNNNGDWFWVDGKIKRQLMDENVNDLFRFSQEYKPQLVGVEISGQQKGFISWLQNEMLRRNIYFALATDGKSTEPGIRPLPNTKKEDRFAIVVPLFKLGKMYFPEEKREDFVMQEAMDELRLVSTGGFKSKHDDFLDTVSMLGSLKTWKPSQEAIPQQIEQQGKTRGRDMWEIPMPHDEGSAMDSYIV